MSQDNNNIHRTVFNWMRSGNQYVAIGHTEANLPPGLHHATTDPYDRPQFNHVPLREELAFEFDDSIMKTVMDAIRVFHSRADRYKKMGIAHRMGILMHGKQGTGKSVIGRLLVQLAAEKGGYGIVVGDLVDYQTAMGALNEMHPSVPTIALLEDIDELIERRGEHMLLQILDGVEETRAGLVFVATTNHLEKLPPRIRQRPGRFDLVIEVGPPDARIRETYVKKLTEKFDNPPVKEIVAASNDMTFAEIRAVAIGVMVFEKAPTAAGEEVRRLGKLEAGEEEDEDEDETKSGTPVAAALAS